MDAVFVSADGLAVAVVAVLVPADSSAQQRRRPGPAQDRGPQVKVLPISVVGNFSNPENAQSAIFSPDGKIVALDPLFLRHHLVGHRQRAPAALAHAAALFHGQRLQRGRPPDGDRPQGRHRAHLGHRDRCGVAGGGTARQIENRQGRGPRPDPYRLGRSARRIVRHLRWRRHGHGLEPDDQKAGAHGAQPLRHDAAHSRSANHRRTARI